MNAQRAVGPFWAVNPEVLVTDLRGELVLLHPVTGQMYSLNEVARTVWLALPAAETALLAAVLLHFDTSETAASADLTALLADLERLNMVRPD